MKEGERPRSHAPQCRMAIIALAAADHLLPSEADLAPGPVTLRDRCCQTRQTSRGSDVQPQ